MRRVFDEKYRLKELGLSNVPEKFICVNHINEPYIQKFIRKNYESGHCSYCNKSLKVVKLEKLMVFMMECIKLKYDDAGEYWGYDGRAGGYLGEYFNNYDLIVYEIKLETDLSVIIDDIIFSIDERPWADGNTYHSKGDDMIETWDNFKSKILHKSRFFFHPKLNKKSNELSVYNILSEFGKLTSKFNLIRTINPDTIVYRCRQHEKAHDVDKIELIVAPSDMYANSSNRFSPIGISMFYGAYEIETAKTETLDYNDTEKRVYTMGKLKINRAINVLDLTNIPTYTSIFNPRKYKNRYELDFIYDFRNDLMKGISRDGNEHLEYIPTQVVTEFLKFDFNKRRKNKIEGILYNSSKDDKKCLVLFWDNSECVNNMDLLDINTYDLF